MSKKNILPVISGGTGLYINSIIYNMDFAGTGGDEELRKELYREAEKKGNDVLYDRLCTLNPELASTLHANNTQRLVRAGESNCKQRTSKKVRSGCEKKQRI